MDRDALQSFVDAVRSVASGMAKDNSRYAISGVLVDPQPNGRDVRLVATDGHCMLLALVPDAALGLQAPVILSGLAVKALAAKNRATAAVDFILTPAGCTVKTAAGTNLQFDHVDGQFPPYKDVVPREVVPDAVVQPFAPALLATMVGWMEKQEVHLVPTGTTKGRPILILAPGHPHWLGVLMPVNLDDNWQAWPQEQAEQLERVCGRLISAQAPPPAEPADFNFPVLVAGQIQSARLKAATPSVAGTIGQQPERAAA